MTTNGQEYVPDASSFAADNYLLHADRLIQRDPHANIALDNGWDADRYARVEGDAWWRVLVYALDVPSRPVTAHLSILWETGADPSLAENRRGGWSCGSNRRLGTVPAVETAAGPAACGADNTPTRHPDLEACCAAGCPGR